MQGITSNTNSSVTNHFHHQHHQSAHVIVGVANANHASTMNANTSNNANSNPTVITLPADTCQGCLEPIQDRYYLQVTDKAWHLNCLRCAECKSSLDSQHTCFSKDGLIYCKDDYYK